MAKKTKKQLVQAEGEICFWINNGPVLKNLNELYDALVNMNDETFSHHVSGDRNDFAKWVDEVLQDSDLAKKLVKCKNPSSMLKIVGTYLKNNYEL